MCKDDFDFQFWMIINDSSPFTKPNDQNEMVNTNLAYELKFEWKVKPNSNRVCVYNSELIAGFIQVKTRVW